MEYLGISREPLTAQQIENNKIFDENISIGYGVTGNVSFLCRICHQSGPFPMHTGECPIGQRISLTPLEVAR